MVPRSGPDGYAVRGIFSLLVTNASIGFERSATLLVTAADVSGEV
jgi:hypothetical protein